jgi:thiol:disulfide interchange protein
VLHVEPPLAGALTAAAVDAPLEALETAPRGAPVQPGEGARALAAALVLALAGGLILNLMPCVFPVLAIKAAGIAGAAGGRVRAAGLAYGAGVLASLWALAAVLLVLRAGGQALGWGFQLQSAPFVAALVLLMTAVGVNLLGAYEAGIGLAARAGGADRGTGLRGAFFSGVLATALATPCTAPFMAAALGYALAQPAPAALAVFTALGLGLAAPFLLLAEVPGLATRLPRPGPWMARLRQGLAFPMLAAALWLAWVYTRQRGPDAAALLLGAALALAFGLWAWGFVQRGRRALPLTGVAAGGALAAVLLALALRGGGTPTPGGIAWAPWSAAAVAQHRADGRPVFVDFTADWCLTCKVNERVALADARVARAFAAADVAALKADWTAYDPAITAALAALGRSGVPVYVYYPPGAPGRVLPELLTPGIVLRALEGGG